ncbi:MAG: pilus assembly protein [Rhodobacterales bacterium]|nr:pilus assembly protein [Rhodobacterales bacterium]MDX5401747.1 pilus assembly protein [Rhodobacterales bacterium]
MIRLHRLRNRLRGFVQADHGSVTLDFVLVLPVVLTILLASFEAGYSMLRLVMLERALDITVRDLRVGALGTAPTHNQVRARFCEQATLMPACMSDVKLEMQVIDRNTWTGFTTTPTCVDRTTTIEPALNFTQGGTNEVVTIRACAVFDPFFPTTKWGLRLDLDASGGYQLAAMSAFVNEPR